MACAEEVGGSFENSHRSLELRAPAFPTPLPVRLFHFLSRTTLPSSFFPARACTPPVSCDSDIAPSLTAPPCLSLLPDSFARLHSAGSHPVLPGRSANLFRRLGDGRNRSTLYSSRIDRQPRTDMEALYFPSSHLRVALERALCC